MSMAGSGAAGTRAVLLGLAFAVGIAAWAPRAFAQTIFSLDLLWEDELNGANITLETPWTKKFNPIAVATRRITTNVWTVTGAPAGVTVRVVRTSEISEDSTQIGLSL